jgi:hypothetical protein
VRFLESSDSPLTPAQKAKMNSELHADPSLGHHKKGSNAMAKPAATHRLREMRIERHYDKAGKITGHTVHHHMEPRRTGKSGAFIEHHTESYPFGSGDHDKMVDHVDTHLGEMAAAPKVADTDNDGD